MIALRKSTSLAAALGLALTLSACSSSSESATDTASSAAPSSSPSSSVSVANAAFCTSTAALKTELGNMKTLVTAGSLDLTALQSQKDAVKAAAEQAKTDAQGLDAAITAEVTAAQAAFQTAIDAIPADQTGVKEVAAYVAAGAVFVKAVDVIDNQVGCS